MSFPRQDPNEWLKKNQGYVRYGNSMFNKSKAAEIETCKVHPKYKPGYEFDVAVCKTKEDLELDKKSAWPICLPGPKAGKLYDNGKLVKQGEKCDITGWGYYKMGKKKDEKILPDLLQGNQATVKRVNPDRHAIETDQPACMVSSLE